MKVRFIVVFLFLWVSYHTQAQEVTGADGAFIKQYVEQLQAAKNSNLSDEQFRLHKEIAVLYRKNGFNNQAIEHYNGALDAAITLGDAHKQRFAYLELGLTYNNISNLQAAANVFEKAVVITEEISDKKVLVHELLTIAYLHRRIGNYESALKNLKRAENTILMHVYEEALIDKCYQEYAQTYKDMGDTKQYMKYFNILEKKELERTKKEFNEKTEQIAGEVDEIKKKVTEKDKELEEKNVAIESISDSLKEAERIRREQVLTLQNQQLKIENQQKDLDHERRVKTILISGLALIVAFTSLLVFQFLQIKKVNRLLAQRNNEILAQKEEIQEKSDMLGNRNIQIEKQNEQITASIRYAQTIQHSMLPPPAKLGKVIENFIIFRPKDIVSGDFYWTLDIKVHGHDYHYIAAVDCTGHGVPGAFMSLIGNRLLNEIVLNKKIYAPDKILETLDKELQIALNQEETDNDDGMDVALCKLEKLPDGGTQIEFCGANRPLIIYKKSDQKVGVYKGTLATIGGVEARTFNEEFRTVSHVMQSGDMIYLTSDGFVDQNNRDRRKFGTKRLIQTIEKAAEESCENQKKILEEALEKHQQDTAQRDDITLIGLKIG